MNNWVGEGALAKALRGAVRPSVTLVLLFGLAWLGLQGLTTSLEGGRVAVVVGFVLLAASVAGSLAAAVGLPKITGYILMGIVAGPSVLGLVPSAALDDLHLIDDFALALIAMLAGGELRAESLKPQARTIAAKTLAVTVVVWVGMAAVVLAVRPWIPFAAELPWAAAIGVALLLGVWAANSSPDLTVAVIEEQHAKGPMVEVILGVTIVKDVVVIVLFTLTLALVTPLVDPSRPFTVDALVTLAEHVGGALVLGAVGGWIFSQYLGGDSPRRRSPLATFLFAYAIVVVSAELHVELLLVGVTAGFVIENLSSAGEKMIDGIASVAVVVFAFFFAIAGAGLDLGALVRFGPVAVVLFGARLVLTRWGARYGAKVAGAPAAIRDRAWLGLISQGGVSLGLVLLIAEAFQDFGSDVVALAMAMIIGNILLGPVLLGRALASEGGEGSKKG